MKYLSYFPKLGLYSRFFILFSVTTLLLAGTIAIGSFTFSENEVKKVIDERHDRIYNMMTSFHGQEIDLEKMREQVKEPKVELKVQRGDKIWTTWDAFPDLAVLKGKAEKIKSLYFVKYNSRYYLLASKGDTWIGATAMAANFLVYPSWLVYWPWLVALFILVASYLILRKWLRPVADALHCAQRVSVGEFDFRIEKHPNTELAELTRGLNKMASDLEQVFNAKNELLLAISHELRTPMARMKISLAMLSESSYVNDLKNDIKYMDQLIEQLLEGERLEQGHHVLHLTHYYLPSLIDELLCEFTDSEQIKLQSLVPEEAICIDVGRIKFLLRNLIRNAITHSSEQVEVTLSIEQTENAFIFHVADNGHGIDETALPHIFEPFYCVENINNRSTQGVGLGLYLCQKIAVAHKGSLSVKSETGEGSCFTLELPTKLAKL